MKLSRTAFTLIELMVVVLIVGILAAAAIPIMRGRVDDSKWAEANATAGMIRKTVRIYFLETGSGITGPLNDAAKLKALGIEMDELDGTYFSAKDYNITAVDSKGIATVKVTGSQINAPSGSKTLTADGDWE